MEMASQNMLNKNTVVTTPMSNYGLEITLKEKGISMVRAKVGDRYVVESMRQNGYNLGGEQSGHVVFLDHSTTGDGIIAGLKVLEAMKRTGKPLSELRKSIRLMPQSRHDIRVSKKEPFEKHADIQKAIMAAEKALIGKGRVFVRYSGTEALARVMIEGENEVEISRLSQDIASSIERALG